MITGACARPVSSMRHVSSLFISDLHLDASRPHISALFLSFLANLPADVDQLVILGDLFEAWIGDDAADDLALQVAVALKAVSQRGVKTRFMRGNRDFLLGRDYAERAGMQLLPDACVLTLGGVSTLLLHGDTLCTDDAAYQAFRSTVRSPGWDTRFLSQSVEQRLAFARKARAASQDHQQQVAGDITDVNSTSVVSTFRHFGVSRIIHGHTHRPSIHHLNIDNQPCQRIVLGDWYEQGSVLQVDRAGRIDLRQLSNQS